MILEDRVSNHVPLVILEHLLFYISNRYCICILIGESWEIPQPVQKHKFYAIIQIPHDFIYDVQLTFDV